MNVEFRIVQTVSADGQVIHERWQYRRRSLSINLGNLIVGAWDPWTDVSTVIVTENA